MNPTSPRSDPLARAVEAFDVPLTRDPPSSLPAHRPTHLPIGLSFVSDADLARLVDGDLARLHDEAQERARALRAEALRDFWRHADHLVAHVADQAARSARRFTARLARHRAARAGTDSLDATAPCRP